MINVAFMALFSLQIMFNLGHNDLFQNHIWFDITGQTREIHRAVDPLFCLKKNDCVHILIPVSFSPLHPSSLVFFLHLQ